MIQRSILVFLLIWHIVHFSPVFAEKVIQVAAASSLYAFLPEFKTQFEQLHPYQLKMSFASSGQLYRQIEAGAPFDIYISAHMRYVTALTKSQKVRFHLPLAEGQIALYGRDQPIANSWNDLHGPLLIPHPEIAPFGIAAKEFLQNTGNWQRLQSHLIFGNSAMHSTQMAKAGAATYAILPLQGAKHLVEKQIGFYKVIPNRLHSPLFYTWVALKQSSEANRLAVDTLSQYAQSESVQNLMIQHSLIPELKQQP